MLATTAFTLLFAAGAFAAPTEGQAMPSDLQARSNNPDGFRSVTAYEEESNPQKTQCRGKLLGNLSRDKTKMIGYKIGQAWGIIPEDTDVEVKDDTFETTQYSECLTLNQEAKCYELGEGYKTGDKKGTEIWPECTAYFWKDDKCPGKPTEKRIMYGDEVLPVDNVQFKSMLMSCTRTSFA